MFQLNITVQKLNSLWCFCGSSIPEPICDVRIGHHRSTQEKVQWSSYFIGRIIERFWCLLWIQINCIRHCPVSGSSGVPTFWMLFLRKFVQLMPFGQDFSTVSTVTVRRFQILDSGMVMLIAIPTDQIWSPMSSLLKEMQNLSADN